MGKENSGIICINGAGAHLMNPQDIVIIATFAELSLCEAGSFKPTVVCVDKNNKAIS